MSNGLFKNKYRIDSARLKNYDYSQNGYYFITICTHQKHHFFGRVVDGFMILNGAGEIVFNEWKKTEIIRKYVTIDEFVVMPNHLHGIIVINKHVCADNGVGMDGRVIGGGVGVDGKISMDGGGGMDGRVIGGGVGVNGKMSMDGGGGANVHAMVGGVGVDGKISMDGGGGMDGRVIGGGGGVNGKMSMDGGGGMDGRVIGGGGGVNGKMSMDGGGGANVHAMVGGVGVDGKISMDGGGGMDGRVIGGGGGVNGKMSMDGGGGANVHAMVGGVGVDGKISMDGGGGMDGRVIGGGGGVNGKMSMDGGVETPCQGVSTGVTGAPNVSHGTPAIYASVKNWKTGTIGAIVNQFKRQCTIQIRQKIDNNFQWQPRFHDSIIQTDDAVRKIRWYIKNNPAKWIRDRHNRPYTKKIHNK
jgi:hypothetical protein